MSGENTTREALLKLSDERKALEEELATFLDVLKTQGVGMEDNLVDSEGFPRNDIDVHQVRIARNKIIYLRNDLKDIMSEMERGLENIHEQTREGLGVAEPMETISLDCHLEPFAHIDLVSPESPAHLAGLQVGDRIAEFGSINADNFGNLKQVGDLVQNSKDQNVRVKVIREGKSTAITLKPRTWSGRGLLGCNIVPMDKVLDR
ncbi:hypothetical protein TCAL_04578 [Tigriopus californicus]|uniref:26S proteasome non-ATPase regulatory subunit 9 n=2 Tax=Tigriopus californicus TaxID=6832 RepID=A0A553PB87_TIGCA|nr:hypothetical protein TCAL_04578 [Tigriopus californicus]|eukprot:TCALIF_04578-PA protein Name:"Similar to Psmd9 26S proteasome non-ATPase regulatory subunit 9 (Rattus norvegicus)" AED:0.00 eAED:0.00 QI:0/-1/0/1/-1/1/1/0/204